MATGNTFVEYIEWENDNGSLTGSERAVVAEGTELSEGSINQSADMTTTATTVGVAGSLHGSALSVSFGDQPPVLGTTSGRNFTLNAPQSDGSLAPIVFKPASVDQFNAAVATLDDRVQSQNRTVQNNRRSTTT